MEFIIAQTPHEMRSLIVGLCYAAYGLGYIIDINGKYPFNCKEDIVCQNLYYIVMKSASIVIILILFMILANRTCVVYKVNIACKLCLLT